MSDYEQIESFWKNGFVIIPDVLGKDEIQEIRARLRAITESMPDGKRMLTIGDLLTDAAMLDALMKVQFSTKLLTVLSRIIDEKFVYINDLQVQCNMFGLGSGGWHFDAGTEADNLNNRYLYDPNYRFGKVGVYLQDNTMEFGGGINVIPGSHRAFKVFRGNGLARHTYRVLQNKMRLFMAGKFGKELMVPIKAGSALYFDMRLLHHSSPPAAVAMAEEDKTRVRRIKNDGIGHDDAKYVFYWEAGCLENARHYLENASNRAICEEVGISRKSGHEIFFAEFLSYFYEDDYPKEYVSRLEQSKVVSIACPDKHTADVWKAVRKSFG